MLWYVALFVFGQLFSWQFSGVVVVSLCHVLLISLVCFHNGDILVSIAVAFY